MGDYGKLFGILIANQLRVGQLRAKINIPVNNELENKEKIKVQQQYATTLFDKLLNDPVVLLPEGDKSKSVYDEISSSKNQQHSKIKSQISGH